MIPLGILAASSVIAVPVMLTSDSFNRPNGAINGTSTDSAYGGSPYTWNNSASIQVASNQLRTTHSAKRSASIPVFESDVSVSAKVNAFPSSGYVRLCARGTASDLSNNHWGVGIQYDGRLELQVTTAGASTVFADTPNGTVKLGDVVTLLCKGSNISVLVNGVTVASTTSTALPSGGYVGVACNGSTLWRLDDFKVETAP